MDTRPKPSLDTIRIPTPCSKSWGDLTGDERRRFCDACQLHVTNLSALTRREADEFLAAKQGRTCVSYSQRADGSIVTREERATRLRPWARLRTAAAALFAFVPFLAGCEQGRPEGPEPDTDHSRTLGRPAAKLGEIAVVGGVMGGVGPQVPGTVEPDATSQSRPVTTRQCPPD